MSRGVHAPTDALPRLYADTQQLLIFFAAAAMHSRGTKGDTNENLAASQDDMTLKSATRVVVRLVAYERKLESHEIGILEGRDAFNLLGVKRADESDLVEARRPADASQDSAAIGFLGLMTAALGAAVIALVVLAQHHFQDGLLLGAEMYAVGVLSAALATVVVAGMAFGELHVAKREARTQPRSAGKPAAMLQPS